VDFHGAAPRRPLALVLGHEHQGVSVGVLDACDQHVKIKMRGMKNSLNVAVAEGPAGAHHPLPEPAPREA